MRGGTAFLAAFRRGERKDGQASPYAPPATLIVPLRGLDPGLDANLAAYFEMPYPDVQVLLVADRESDPGYGVAERVRARFPAVPSVTLVAGSAEGRGQKVHNLLFALGWLREADRVLVFGDSDIRPHRRWLHDLVAPLSDRRVGASTGFRWYVPVRGGIASALRSVWNAGVASLMTAPHPPFAWGGAMAMRRTTFEAAAIRERWQGALSDDYVVTRAVLELGLQIRFEPRCLSFTREDCGLRQLLDWSFRQIAITRVYRPSLWRVGLAGEVLGNVSFWGGLTVLVAAAAGGSGALVACTPLAVLLAATYGVRGAKGWLRLAGVRALFPEIGAELRPWNAAYVLATPLVSLISLAGFLRSALTRRIRWRGIEYHMVSAARTDVLPP